jgi:hypothetical protein
MGMAEGIAAAPVEAVMLFFGALPPSTSCGGWQLRKAYEPRGSAWRPVAHITQVRTLGGKSRGINRWRNRAGRSE